MAKRAHITSRPHEVGDRVIGLCGKDFKVKTLWNDLPDDKPICRECVNVAVTAMTEADKILTGSRRMMNSMRVRLDVLDDTLNPAALALDMIAEAADDFAAEREVKAQNKEARQKAAVTCTCTWGPDQSIRDEDPDCPIHGGTTVVFEPDESVDLDKD